MDVSIVREYLETKKQRTKLESQLSKLKSDLSKTQSREAELQSQVSMDNLITAKSVKVINGLLSSHRPFRLGDFPVSFARTTLKSGQLRFQVIFSQPLFSGWKTETSYYSYQSCPWQLETPEPPDENHIPQYKQVMDGNWDVVCWERTENGLRLWVDEKRGVEFRWNEGGDANISRDRK